MGELALAAGQDSQDYGVAREIRAWLMRLLRTSGPGAVSVEA